MSKNLSEITFKALTVTVFAFLLFLAGCAPPANSNSANAANDAANAGNNAAESNANSAAEAATYGTEENLTEDEIESGRMDQDWKKFVQIEASTEKNSQPNNEKWSDVTADAVNNQKQYTPLSGDVAGPSVFRTQLLLDRTNFSPGIIDAKWGKNTEKAVYWLQKSEGLPANGTVDKKTFERMIELAGKPDKLVIEHKLTEKEVSGPFKEIPDDIYEKAKMDCMCYESLEEKLSETFHISPALLKQLNPKADLNNLKAGDTIMVPNLQKPDEGSLKKVARIVVSDGGHYVHGLDEQGKIVVHYPSTLGSEYNPSPSGEYKINAIAKDPWWHYQPKLLGEGDGKDAKIPPGPNNAVGLIWMDLSKPHYGIHGTSAPETIGYATSHGCIRLTNWDALDLGDRVAKGVPVEFRDAANRSGVNESNSNSSGSNNRNSSNGNSK